MKLNKRYIPDDLDDDPDYECNLSYSYELYPNFIRNVFIANLDDEDDEATMYNFDFFNFIYRNLKNDNLNEKEFSHIYFICG